MGGYGALSYAARHPGTFAAAASFSGALEVGSAAAWGGRSANEARWRAHLPISIAAGLRWLALVELRTGDGRPGPLDPPGTKPGCPGCALERYLRPATSASTRGCARSASVTCGTTTGPGRTPGPTGAATCARRCPTSCACSPAPDSGQRRRAGRVNAAESVSLSQAA